MTTATPAVSAIIARVWASRLGRWSLVGLVGLAALAGLARSLGGSVVAAGGMPDLATVGLDLAVVVGVLFIVLWFLRRGTVGSASTGRMRVLESRGLGSRTSVHLVAVGDRCLVVGQSAAGLVALADLPAADLEPAPAGGEFGALVARAGRALDAEPVAPVIDLDAFRAEMREAVRAEVEGVFGELALRLSRASAPGAARDHDDEPDDPPDDPGPEPVVAPAPVTPVPAAEPEVVLPPLPVPNPPPLAAVPAGRPRRAAWARASAGTPSTPTFADSLRQAAAAHDRRGTR